MIAYGACAFLIYSHRLYVPAAPTASEKLVHRRTKTTLNNKKTVDEISALRLTTIAFSGILIHVQFVPESSRSPKFITAPTYRK
jgi:hypothetical protein